MAPTTEPPAANRGRLRWPTWLALGLVLLAFIAWAAWRWWPVRVAGLPPDPRVTIASPFQNTRPTVKYVGDAVCASCHQDIVDTYAHHPMGRATFPTASAPELEKYADPASNPFTHGPLRYDIERRDGKVFHVESLVDPQGKVRARLEGEAEFAVGSGTRGRSYLINRDGFFFESPISWYTQKQRWDVSPGYHTANMHFERPIRPGCLYCHCNFAHEIPNTSNRYSAPYFSGFVIGCERCHGPGELHAERPVKVNGVDPTIVNPKHLSPALREDVCQQCHLQGENRVVRAGRSIFDYRPGLPLHEFQAVFVKPPERTDSMKAVSQVEQMYVSKCFQASAGKMGCISCHDPHRAAKPEQKVAFYRQRCLNCHEDRPCTAPVATRLKVSPKDSCVQCHMPQLGSNIAHTALTDHRVLRRGDGPDKGDHGAGLGGLGGMAANFLPFRHFHADLVDANSVDAGRDLGLAITEFARQIEHQAPVVPLARKAQPLLEAGTRTWAGDAPAWDALGYAYRKQGKFVEAQEAYNAALAAAPEREQTLADLVDMAAQTKKSRDAIGYLERLTRVNPQNSTYYLSLATWLERAGEWERSAEACRAALRLNIVSGEARRLLIANYLRLGRTDDAQKEFDLLVLSAPTDRTSLEAWFAAQKRAR